MKHLLAHLGMVVLLLLWLHFKRGPSTAVPQPPKLNTPAPVPTLAPKAATNCDGPKKVDPYEINRWMNTHPDCGFASVLSLLKTDSVFHGGFANRKLKTGILNLELRATVLEVTSGSGSATEFYFFNYADSHYTSYRFLGKVEPVDYVFTYHIVSGEDQSWFVVRDRWAHGSSIGLRGETWYEVTATAVKQVLTYPVSGCEFLTRGLRDRLFDGVAVSHEVINGHTTVKVKLNVNYVFPDDYATSSDIFLAKASQAIYVRNNKSGEFKLAKRQSTITEEELGDVYSIESLDDPKFLKYNFAALTQIASHGSKKQKKALKKYLLELPGSRRSHSLLAILH